MKRHWLIGALLFIGGIAITFLGFVYDIMFAGIPFQDAPKQLQDQYASHSSIAWTMEAAGLLTAAAAIVFGATGFVRRSKISRRPTPSP